MLGHSFDSTVSHQQTFRSRTAGGSQPVLAVREGLLGMGVVLVSTGRDLRLAGGRLRSAISAECNSVEEVLGLTGVVRQ